MNTSSHHVQRAMCCCTYLFVLLALPLFALLGTATVANAQGVSTGDGTWVWQNPLPQGNSLNDAWGTDANNVWAVGWNGTILKWNGSVWSPQSSGTTDILHSVWGTDANNVWAVGGQRHDPQMERERLEPAEQRHDGRPRRRVGDRRQQRLGRRRGRHDPQMERERLEPAEQRHDGLTLEACGGQTPTTSGP